MARQPKEIDEAKMLRDYLRRQIANIHKQISGKANSLRDSFRSVFSDVVGGFANANYNSMTDVLRDIYDDINDKHTSSSVYNYFDLDTLYSYLQYVKKVNEGIDKSRRERGSYQLKAQDFDKGILNARRWLNTYAGKEESGFYSITDPIHVLIKNGELAPEKTLSPTEFVKKYDDVECSKRLEVYLTDKHEKIKPDFTYNGESYYIENRELYIDLDGHPVTYIDALNKNSRLMGYFDNAMKPYYGDLYDIEGNFVVDAEQTGVEVFVNKEKRDSLRNKSQGRDV